MNLHELKIAAETSYDACWIYTPVKREDVVAMADEVISILKRTAEACDECDGTGEVYRSRDPSGRAVYDPCDTCLLIRKHAGL